MRSVRVRHPDGGVRERGRAHGHLASPTCIGHIMRNPLKRLRRQRVPHRAVDTRLVIVPAFPSELTWTCHVCGRERPDDRIGVYSRRWEVPGSVTFHENVRYCNDRPQCVLDAAGVTFLKHDGKGILSDAELVSTEYKYGPEGDPTRDVHVLSGKPLHVLDQDGQQSATGEGGTR